MSARHLAAAMLAVSAGLVLAPASAQEQTVTRTELMRAPVQGFAGKEGVVYTADFAPGAAAPRHTHPGQEFIYMLEGSLVLEPDGAPARTLKVGETATLPPNNHVHGARNASTSAPAKVLVVLLLDKGKPLVIPAQ